LDHALWIDEIEFWKNDHYQVLAKLGDLEKALKRQTRSLFQHAQVIKAHIESHHQHEETIANAEIDPSSENFKVADEQAIAVHQRERRAHAKHSEVHHALKTNHYKTMAMFNMLYKQIHKI
jgi:3-dehydroquinate dehydratase